MERFKNRLRNRFNHLVHSLVPGRRRSPSPGSTVDPQASSSPLISTLSIPDISIPHISSSHISSFHISSSSPPISTLSIPNISIPDISSSHFTSSPILLSPISSVPGISLSNTYPSTVNFSSGIFISNRIDDLASNGFKGVKMTLRLVESATDVSPPLKSTVEGLLGVIDIMEVRDFQLSVDRNGVDRLQTTAQNQQDCQDLEQKLRDVVLVINNHANYSTTPTFTSRLEGLSV